MRAVKVFIKELSKSPLLAKYFGGMTCTDSRRVECYHREVHGDAGMIGSLDCSHFVWGNCPVAHHGQYQGKEGKPTLVVEAMADHSLFVWHKVFGYCGTLNDTTIWDNSLLLQSLLDGSPLLIGFLLVTLINFVTSGRTDFDHFCCSDEAVLRGTTISTESSSFLLRNSP